MKQERFDVAVLYEHPEWHRPLFDTLEKRNISHVKIDLTKGSYNCNDIPQADVYYNMVSPSAYLRGNQKAISFAYALCRSLEYAGKVVVNGSKSMSLEFSKSSQIALLKSLAIDHPQTFVFNDITSLEKHSSFFDWPMILKPEQGGSGARMYLVNSMEELRRLLERKPELWFPDHLLLLQEQLSYDKNFGIVRLEFLGGKLLYAMRVVTHGSFNLCPSVVCNPEDGTAGNCAIDPGAAKPEFYPYWDVSSDAIDAGRKIIKASGHAIGSVEYIEAEGDRRVFYDINANSNLRTSIGKAFDIDPFLEVTNYLKSFQKNHHQYLPGHMQPINAGHGLA